MKLEESWDEYRRLRYSLEQNGHCADEHEANVVDELRVLQQRTASSDHRNLHAETDRLVMRIQRGDFRA
jgi:hypothetical protein